MKKSVKIILSILIVSLLLLPLVLSQTDPAAGINDNLGDAKKIVDKVQNVSENFRDVNASKNYLRQEWGKVLENNKYLGPVYSFLNGDFMTKVFWLFFNEKFSLSWSFIIIIILWFYTVSLVWNLVMIRWFALRSGIDYLISISIATLAAHLGPYSLYRWFITGVGTLFDLSMPTWLKVASFIIAILILGIIKLWLRWNAKKAKEKREEEDKSNLHHESELAKRRREGMEEGARAIKGS